MKNTMNTNVPNANGKGPIPGESGMSKQELMHAVAASKTFEIVMVNGLQKASPLNGNAGGIRLELATRSCRSCRRNRRSDGAAQGMIAAARCLELLVPGTRRDNSSQAKRHRMFEIVPVS